jgi:ABC-type transport system involved in cytochrome bd biosynthesis fused ATPase/permease subunit
VECQPGAAITAPVAIDQRQDNSTGKQINPALPWITAMLAGTACGLVIALCLLQPWEHAARAAKAEMRAEFAEQLAQQDARIQDARESARIAKDWTDQKNAELKVYRSTK